MGMAGGEGFRAVDPRIAEQKSDLEQARNALEALRKDPNNLENQQEIAQVVSGMLGVLDSSYKTSPNDGSEASATESREIRAQRYADADKKDFDEVVAKLGTSERELRELLGDQPDLFPVAMSADSRDTTPSVTVDTGSLETSKTLESEWESPERLLEYINDSLSPEYGGTGIHDGSNASFEQSLDTRVAQSQDGDRQEYAEILADLGTTDEAVHKFLGAIPAESRFQFPK